MYIETPVPAIETDTALQQLHQMREMAKQGRWSRGLLNKNPLTQQMDYCAVGWAGIFNGWNSKDHNNLSTAAAFSAARWDVIDALSHTGAGHISSYNDNVILGNPVGAVAWMDRAIEYRREQLHA